MTYAGGFLGLPGLRGYWPMSAFDSSGNAIDQSGNGRTLTYNGNPTYNFTTQGGPYLDLDGTGDCLSRADEAGLDIIGTESYVATAQRGLTLGGWFWFDATGTVAMISKYESSSQLSYLLRLDTSTPTFYISDTGSDGSIKSVAAATISTGAWYNIVARFDPSTELALFVNGTKTTNTTTIFAAIFNSTAAFRIGAVFTVPVQLLDGRASNCFLCTMLLSDTAIDNIYQGTRGFYGV